MNVKQLIAAGWTPPADLPELDVEGYEKWRKALTTYCVMRGDMPPSNPLDSIDREKIDALRLAFSNAPVAGS